MTTQQYLESIRKRFMLGHATEHSFRGDLQQLIETDRLMKEVDGVSEV
ncbi:hypothetical protein [Arthrospiribacter ruber]|nr:hypothetical protein [Arthrospiribacter ruber]